MQVFNATANHYKQLQFFRDSLTESLVMENKKFLYHLHTGNVYVVEYNQKIIGMLVAADSITHRVILDVVYEPCLPERIKQFLSQLLFYRIYSPNLIVAPTKPTQDFMNFIYINKFKCDSSNKLFVSHKKPVMFYETNNVERQMLIHYTVNSFHDCHSIITQPVDFDQFLNVKIADNHIEFSGNNDGIMVVNQTLLYITRKQYENMVFSLGKVPRNS